MNKFNRSALIALSAIILFLIPITGCDDQSKPGSAEEKVSDAPVEEDINPQPSEDLKSGMLAMLNGVEPLFSQANSVEEIKAAAPAFDELFDRLNRDVVKFFKAGGTLAQLRAVMNIDPEVVALNDKLTAAIESQRSKNPKVGAEIDALMKGKMGELGTVISRNAKQDEIEEFQQEANTKPMPKGSP